MNKDFYSLNKKNTYLYSNGKYQNVAEYVERHVKSLQPDLGLGISINTANKYRHLAELYYQFWFKNIIPKEYDKYDDLQVIANKIEKDIDKIFKEIKRNKGL